jgi:biotin operon repressor
VSLRADLQDIVNTLLAAGGDDLSLNELADALGNRSVSYAEVEEMIEQLERGGIELESPEPADLPAELRQVILSARTLTGELGHAPTPSEIADRSGLPETIVRRALVYARVLSR